MKVDCWAVGVIAFELLTGKRPFNADNLLSLYRKIKYEQPQFDLLKGVSRDARKFIEACLTKDSQKRPTVEALLDYNWIKKQPDQPELNRSRQLALLSNMVQFEQLTTAQAWICSIIANQMTHSEQLQELQALFLKWDSRKDGVLRSDEIESNVTEICRYFKLQKPDVQRILSAADIDKDGELDFTDFVTAAIDKQNLITQANLEGVFKLLDRDQKGYASQDDIGKLLGATYNFNDQRIDDDEKTEDIMSQFDNNSPSRVNKDVFFAHMYAALDKLPILQPISHQKM